MAKTNTHTVQLNDTDPNFVGTINVREVERKVRKPYAPATKQHRDKTLYRRTPKHPSQGQE